MDSIVQCDRSLLGQRPVVLQLDVAPDATPADANVSALADAPQRVALAREGELLEGGARALLERRSERVAEGVRVEDCLIRKDEEGKDGKEGDEEETTP